MAGRCWPPGGPVFASGRAGDQAPPGGGSTALNWTVRLRAAGHVHFCIWWWSASGPCMLARAVTGQ